MKTTARRMYEEALLRIEDADSLARPVSASDSSALLRILGFEILLKSALRLAGVSEARTHDYSKLWGKLPAATQAKLLAEASARMPGHTDFSDVHRLLSWYRFVFERARYHYELYEGYTDEEFSELGRLWESIGAPTEEAVVQYYPRELECLVHALRTHVAGELSN